MRELSICLCATIIIVAVHFTRVLIVRWIFGAEQPITYAYADETYACVYETYAQLQH